MVFKKIVSVIIFITVVIAVILLPSSCRENTVPTDSLPTAPSDAGLPTEAPSAAPTEAPTVPAPAEGWGEVNGARVYYRDGVLQTDTIIGNDEDGWFYAGSDGTVDTGYCNGVSYKDEDWIVIEGDAYRVQTDSDKCLLAAAKDVAACTESGMSRENKLKACFDYIKEHYLEGVLHDPPVSYEEEDWPITYANDIFVYGKGDCYSYGAAYAYMARAIGYEDVYAVNSGGHGWAEVENRTYDPEWSMHSNNYSYYGMSYDEECDVPYAFAIESYTDLKRRQIVVHG